jgi:hypothetical protein
MGKLFNHWQNSINWNFLYKIVTAIVFVGLIINPLGVIIKNSAKYTARDYHSRFESLKFQYYSSQYVNKNPTGSMPDEYLESFAGGAFLQGMNPILIVHDQPPVGRYVIALSILLFDNENTIPLFLLVVASWGVYLISKQLLKNTLLSLIPLGIFINESIFLHKLTYMPLLEPIQLPFIIFSLYGFIRYIKQNYTYRWLFFTVINLGFVISIRYFVLGATLFFAMVGYCMFQKKIRQAALLITSSFVAIVMLLSSYYQTWLSGYSVRQIVGIQKYIFMYHKSAFVHPLSFWDLLLFNRWHTWWGENAIIQDSEWNILWPLSFAIIVIGLLLSLKKYIQLSKIDLILLFWIIAYCSMLSVGYTSTRYFLPLIPFLYILAASLLRQIFINFRRKIN